MPSPGLSAVESRIKKGVDALEKAMTYLFNLQGVFLTRLQKEYESSSITTRVYELQKDVSAVLFHMAVAHALSTGHLPSLGSAGHAMNAEDSEIDSLKDEEAETSFGSNINRSIKKDIQALTGDKTIEDFRNEILRMARELSIRVNAWISARDTTGTPKPKALRRTKSDGQELEDNTSTNGTSLTTPQRSNSKRSSNQSAGSPENLPRKSRSQVTKNGTQVHPGRDTELATEAETKQAKGIIRQSPQSNAPVQYGEFASIVQTLGASALEQSKSPKVVSNPKRPRTPLTNTKPRNRSSTDRPPELQLPQSASQNHESTPPNPMSPASTRRRSLQSSYHSNDSATKRSRHTSSRTLVPSSEQADASNRPCDDKDKAERGKSTWSAHEMFFPESPPVHQESRGGDSERRPDRSEHSDRYSTTGRHVEGDGA